MNTGAALWHDDDRAGWATWLVGSAVLALPLQTTE